MLIETGLIPDQNKVRARNKIRSVARQNATRYRGTSPESDNIYYGYVTNETLPRIKGLNKL